MTEPGPIRPTPRLSAPSLPASIVLASTVAETGRLHDWLDGLFAGSSVPEAAGHAIRLCLEEAVMNVVLHGYGPGGPGAIAVALHPDPGRIVATVSDDAAEFDPTIPRPPRPSSGVGGRGLGLMQRYARAVRYQRRDGQNHLTLEFAV